MLKAKIMLLFTGFEVTETDFNKIEKNGDDTATRLLDAAEELFAENGLNGTSSRDITSKANCNLASINYYFNGKENLYHQVCKRRLKILREIRIESIKSYMASSGDKSTLEGLLFSFSDAFVSPLINKKSGPNIMKLIIREMLYPQLPANMVFEEMVEPMTLALQDAMLKICPDLKPKKALWAIFSLVSQLIHLIHIEDIMPSEFEEKILAYDRREAIEHIVTFTSSAIRASCGDEGVKQNA